ncbi:uncharacterized protein CBL_03764 [Carabus blaptoides fortunei]
MGEGVSGAEHPGEDGILGIGLFEGIGEKEFRKKKGLENVIGAIDGSHIPIKRPKEHDVDYVNRKGWHSIVLQGTVNEKKIFIDVSCGEPGSLHDARVLRKFALYAQATTIRNFFRQYLLLGDSAYPSLPWLVPPFGDNGHLSQNQLVCYTSFALYMMIWVKILKKMKRQK